MSYNVIGFDSNTVYLSLLNPLNTASLTMYRGCGNQCDAKHCDKKPLEGYDKDSEHVHRWLPIEFINEK